jgi:serine/threonine-protein kinase
MRHFLYTTLGIIFIAFINFLPTPSVRAGDNWDCSDRCLLLAQYPDYNNMTPDQQYQERQREYREQQNQEYYDRERQQRDLEQQLERRRPNSYGAIAYSPDGGNYGYSEQFANRAQAEQRARQECGKNDCEIATWYYNSCGALAADDDGSWGAAQGSNEQQANRTAQARCANEGGKNCKVIVSHCSR